MKKSLDVKMFKLIYCRSVGQLGSEMLDLLGGPAGQCFPPCQIQDRLPFIDIG